MPEAVKRQAKIFMVGKGRLTLLTEIFQYKSLLTREIQQKDLCIKAIVKKKDLQQSLKTAYFQVIRLKTA